MVKVKICGFTNTEDLRVACTLGVDMVGTIVEIPKSPRRVTIEQAKQILAAASKGVDKVAVAMPKNLGEVERIARELKPDYLQIHLTFPTDEILELKKRLGIKLISVISVSQKVEGHQEIISRAIEAARIADFLMLDTKGPSGGGTGLTHDWSLSRRIRDAVGKPMFLAGGLNPSNVKEAIRLVQPYGVDVSTGVESSPGKKDARLMSEFIEAARGGIK